MKPSQLYRPSLGLLTDFYELTMAQAYRRAGTASTPAVFNMFFRKPPFGAGYALSCGLAALTDYLEHFSFTIEDADFLAAQVGSDGAPLFAADFLTWLQTPGLLTGVDVDAIPEGTVVFAQEPLVRVRGPLAVVQLFESALLNLVNYATLVATASSLVCAAAGEGAVLEFGLRRAQGIDGALTASYASYVGGAAATSNTLAGRLFGIPVRGTHAHSWVLSFASEAEAFAAYGAAMPGNATFLVDTYDTLSGVAAAIEEGKALRAAGHELGGIRLDSGDLAYLSIEARRMLDEAGFPKARIVASNDLDPTVITALRAQGARIDTYGVGTRLVTCHDQPALGGVYKLVAIADGPGGAWRTPIKISEDAIKVSIPGILGVRRYYDERGTARADMIYDETAPAQTPLEVVNPASELNRHAIEPAWRAAELLVPVLRDGTPVYDPPTATEARVAAASSLAALDPTVRRALNPHRYPAGLEAGLSRRRTAMIEEQLDHKLAAQQARDRSAR